MKFRILAAGRLTEPFYKAGVQEYLKRLQAYGKFELNDTLEATIPQKASAADIEKALKKEGDKMLSMITDDEVVITMDLPGKRYTSEEFAHVLNQWNESGKARVNFIIGSSYGIDERVKKRANASISFSPMTFPHQLAVLMLTEQIYRGFRILRGEPYHK